MTTSTNSDATPTTGTQQATSNVDAGAASKATPHAGNSTLVASRDVTSFERNAPMIDVHGWTVAGPTGDMIGSVERIMLDANDQKPRYLTMRPANRQGRMLLPIGGDASTDPARATFYGDPTFDVSRLFGGSASSPAALPPRVDILYR